MEKKLASTEPRVLLICEAGAWAHRPPMERLEVTETDDKGCNTSTRGRFRLGGVAVSPLKAAHHAAAAAAQCSTVQHSKGGRQVACCYG